ncbi:MAG: hypothetical protein H7840_08325 [Alphaproteobacteria bacterium]
MEHPERDCSVVRGSRKLDPVTIVFVLSGLGGALIGIRHAVFPIILHPGFVISGLVDYPDWNYLAIAYKSTVTLPVIFVATLLKTGLSVVDTSVVLYVIVGILYMQSFSLIAYSFCRNVLFALIVGVMFMSPFLFHGADYPIGIFSREYYGIIGLGMALYFPALVGVGWYRSAAFVLPVILAVHPSLGAWWIAVTLLCLPSIWKTLDHHTRRAALPFLLAGAGVCAASLGFSLYVRSSVSHAAVDPSYVNTALNVWDGHRNVVIGMAQQLGLIQAVTLTIVLVAWSVTHRKELGSTLLLTQFAAVTGLVSLVLYVVYHVDKTLFPTAVVLTIPTRYLNIVLALTVPVLAGILLRFRATPLGLAGFAAIVVGDVVYATTRLDEATGVVTEGLLLAVAGGAALMLAVGWGRAPVFRVPAVFLSIGDGVAAVASRIHPWALLGGLCITSLVAVVTIGSSLTMKPGNIGFLNKLEAADGAILLADTVDFSGIPVRNVVLIEPTILDYLPYVPEAGPIVEKILDEIYGIDYFAPPQEYYFLGGLNTGGSRSVWEARTEEEWRVIAKNYQLGIMVAPAQWRIRLPRVYNYNGPHGYNLYTFNR